MAVDLTKKPVWVGRMGAYFDSVDVDKSGTVDIGEFLQWAENMRELCKATAAEIVNLREQLKKFFGAMGLKPGIDMTKEEFLQGMNRLAQDELDRKQRGEKTLHEQLNNAFFDIMDINNDGTVTLDELKIVMKACSMDPNGAEAWMNAADKDKSGSIDREELSAMEFDFWFQPDKAANSCMFGEALSGR